MNWGFLLGVPLRRICWFLGKVEQNPCNRREKAVSPRSPRDPNDGILSAMCRGVLRTSSRFTLLVPISVRQFERQSGENRLKIATAVENAQDCYGVGGDLKRNHRAAFETEDT
jgi:hypothetical protein